MRGGWPRLRATSSSRRGAWATDARTQIERQREEQDGVGRHQHRRRLVEAEGVVGAEIDQGQGDHQARQGLHQEGAALQHDRRRRAEAHHEQRHRQGQRGGDQGGGGAVGGGVGEGGPQRRARQGGGVAGRTSSTPACRRARRARGPPGSPGPAGPPPAAVLCSRRRPCTRAACPPARLSRPRVFTAASPARTTRPMSTSTIDSPEAAATSPTLSSAKIVVVKVWKCTISKAPYSASRARQTTRHPPVRAGRICRRVTRAKAARVRDRGCAPPPPRCDRPGAGRPPPARRPADTTRGS